MWSRGKWRTRHKWINNAKNLEQNYRAVPNRPSFRSSACVADTTNRKISAAYTQRPTVVEAGWNKNQTYQTKWKKTRKKTENERKKRILLFQKQTEKNMEEKLPYFKFRKIIIFIWFSVWSLESGRAYVAFFSGSPFADSTQWLFLHMLVHLYERTQARDVMKRRDVWREKKPWNSWMPHGERKLILFITQAIACRQTGDVRWTQFASVRVNGWLHEMQSTELIEGKISSLHHRLGCVHAATSLSPSSRRFSFASFLIQFWYFR